MLYTLAATVILEVACLVWFADRMLARHDRQVAELCQRLQDPGAAVAQHIIGFNQPADPAYLPFDDDAAFLKYATDSFPVTDGDFG